MSDFLTFLKTNLQADWAERIGWTLFHSLWQLTLIAAGYAVVALVLRNRSASARYVVGCVALLAMLGLPMGTFVFLPREAVVVEAVGLEPAVGEGAQLHVLEEGVGAGAGAIGFVEDGGELPRGNFEGIAVPAEASPPVAHEEVGVWGVWWGEWLAVLRPCLPWATAGWLVGVVLLSLRPLWGWLYVRRLRTQGLSSLSESLQQVGERLVQRLRVNRLVRFAQSALVEVPTVVGYFRPMVLLPASAISGLSTAELELILAHELAHVRRHDYLVNLMQTALEALLFYHPGMWWVSRQIRQERENCCDDVAISLNGQRASYIRALAQLEAQRSATPVAVLAATGGSLLARVRRIAKQPGSAGSPQRPWLATVMVLLLVFAIVPATLSIGDGEFSDFDFDSLTGGYEKGIRVANESHRIKAGLLQFHFSDFGRIEDGSLEASLGLNEGYEVVSFRLFDHKTRKLFHDSQWKGMSGMEQGIVKFDIRRVRATDRIRIENSEEPLPSEIDVWLRIVENGAGSPLVIPAREGVSVTRGNSQIVVSQLLRGSMNGKSGPDGRMIWDPKTVHGEASQMTVNFENRGDVLRGRYHLVAIGNDGSRHVMDDKHFRDFKYGRHQYVHLSIPLDAIARFELLPFKKRHKFFFNGVRVPELGIDEEIPNLSRAIPDRIVELIESKVLPFMTDERLKEIHSEFAALVTKYQRDDLSGQRKQAILLAIEKHGADHLRLGSFQPAQHRSLNFAYLNLPDRLLTLQWKIGNAISRPPLSPEEQQRFIDQRRWMTDYINGLPIYHTFTNAAAVSELKERFDDPLCSTLDRPMTDAQFADFQNRLGKYPQDTALDNVVTHMVQKSLYVRHADFSYIKLPFKDQLYGYGAGRFVHLNFKSNRQFRGDTQALRNVDESHSVVQAVTEHVIAAHVITAPQDINGSKEFRKWVNEKSAADFGFDRDSRTACSLFPVRDAKLVLLDAKNWIEADKISDATLRSLLASPKLKEIPLAEYYKAHRDQHKTPPSTEYIGPYIGILTKENRLAVVHVEDFSGTQEISFRVRARAVSKLPKLVPVTSDEVGVSFSAPVDWILEKDGPNQPSINFAQPMDKANVVQATLRISSADNGTIAKIDVTSPPAPRAITSKIFTVDGVPARLTAFRITPTSDANQLIVQIAKGNTSYVLLMVYPYTEHDKYLKLAMAVCKSLRLHVPSRMNTSKSKDKTAKDRFAIYQVVGHKSAPAFGKAKDSERSRILFSDKGSGASRFDAMRPENYALKGLILSDEPLIASDDLEAYDWKKQVMLLKPGEQGRFPKPSVWGVPFVVVVEGEPLFIGAFWTALSSYSANMPTISLDRWDSSRLPNAIHLENSKVLRDGNVLRDLRQDKRLYQALQRAGKLVDIRSTGELWGEVVEGLRVRLRPTQKQWKLNDTPTLAMDLENVSDQDKMFLYLSSQEAECEIEFDGQWYRWADVVILDRLIQSLKAGQARDEAVQISLSRSWVRTDVAMQGREVDEALRLKLTPGKHTVRVAFTPNGADQEKKQPRVVSDSVEIEIVAADTDKDTATKIEGKSSSNSPQETATVFQGTVIDAKTGKPIAKARVEWGSYMAEEGQRQFVFSDAKGEYSLLINRVGLDSRLGVSVVGYAPQWKEILLANNSQTVDFSLAPGQEVAGTVVDEQGKPILGVVVTACTPVEGYYSSFSSPTPAASFPGPSRRVVTDAKGGFQITDLPTGNVQLNFKAKHRHVNDTNYATEKKHRITMSGSGQPGIVVARVVDKAIGKAITDFHFTRRHDPRWSFVNSKQGSFIIAKNRGDELTLGNRYPFYIYASGYAPEEVLMTAIAFQEPLPEGTSTKPSVHKTIELVKSPAFLGRLVDAVSGQPIEGAQLMSTTTSAVHSFEWFDWDRYIDGYHGLRFLQRDTTDAQGDFQFAERATNPIQLVFVLAQGYERKIIRVAKGGFLVDGMQGIIRLAPEARIEGVVTQQGRPRANVQLSISRMLSMPLTKLHQIQETAVSDSEGRFLFDKLSAGTYLVSYDKLAREVVVQPGQRSVVELGKDLGPYTLTGKAPNGANIILLSEFNRARRQFKTTADAQGAYRIAGLRPGRYIAFVFGYGHPALGTHVKYSLPSFTIDSDMRRDLFAKVKPND